MSSLLACATLQSFISFVVGLSPPGILYFSNGKFLYGYWVSFHWRSQINICWMYLLINIFCIFNKNIVFSFWGFWSESQLSHIYDPFSFKSKIVKLNLDRIFFLVFWTNTSGYSDKHIPSISFFGAWIGASWAIFMTLCTGELAKTKKPHFSLSPRQFVLQLVSAWENLHLNQIFSISQQFFGRFLSDLPFGRCWGGFSSQLELNLLSTHYKGREQVIRKS